MNDFNKTALLKADFNPDVRKYWLLSGVWILFVTVAGIPLIIFWWILGLYFTQRYLDRLECLLTEKSLIVRKGIFVRVEKTVPLEKITDLGMVQGPLMRFFNIEKMTVETAGQSSQGALISLMGIRDASSFRDAVLKQRDEMKTDSTAVTDSVRRDGDDQALDVLESIRDTLVRIEHALEHQSGSND